MESTNLRAITAGKRRIFEYWLEFLRPYHKLQPKEMKALSLMLYYRSELSESVNNEDLINQLLFSTRVRKSIREELGNMGPKVFNNLLTSLRRKGVLSIDNIILPALIPIMTEDGFQLTLNFKINEDKS
jgi:hypothetical protein